MEVVVVYDRREFLIILSKFGTLIGKVLPTWSMSSSLNVRGLPSAAARYLSKEYAHQNSRLRLSSST